MRSAKGAKKQSNRQGETFRVVELFAGVGGFRLGLEGYKGNRKPHHKNFETVWFNQWEPSTKRQHAHEVYTARFCDASEPIDESTRTDIAKAVNRVPTHDLLVGGFPCQDYSVARNLSDAKGLVGTKGVLWWSIFDILNAKKFKERPQYLMLENVDRLLNSPAHQRGRDFAIMLSALNYLGYMVEWRVINAADYGMPQRRRRIFILGYKKGSPIYSQYANNKKPKEWLEKNGVMPAEFKCKLNEELTDFTLAKEPKEVSDHFNTAQPKRTAFRNAGIAFNNKVYTANVESRYNGEQRTLGDVLVSDEEIPQEYFISSQEELERWRYLKGAKNEPRKGRNGFEFNYKEGAMAFPDPLDKPSRTIVTGEGGSTPSRFKHVVKTKKGYRRLTPVELERLCMFPDDHTQGFTDTKRAFFMGNALVVGVIDKLGKALVKRHKQ